jgi:hypothetical protein
MRVHREIKREIGCLTLRAMFDIGCALRAFRVGLAEGLAGRYLFSGKHLWHLKHQQLWINGWPGFQSKSHAAVSNAAALRITLIVDGNFSVVFFFSP